MTPQERWKATLVEMNRRMDLCARAKPGPWTVDRHPENDCVYHGAKEMILFYDEGGHNHADAEFIAAHDPTTMLRVLTAAERLMFGHGPVPSGITDGRVCVACGSCCNPVDWPCDTAGRVMDAWLPV